jgi:hypothetical protein
VSDTPSLCLEVRRLADRLRSLPQSRLQVRLETVPPLPGDLAAAAEALRAVDPASLNRAALGHAVAQLMADAAAGVEGRAEPAPPARRSIPVLTVFAVGDQVAVTGADLAAALRGLDPQAPVWSPDGARGTAAATLAAALEAVRALRAVV